MTWFLPSDRLYVTAALLLVLGFGASGCADSASISEGPPVKLSGLAVTPPGALQPAFSPDVTDYTATVSTTDATVVVRARPENGSTTMMIDGQAASAGEGVTVELGQPPSTKSILIRLTDQSGTQTTYVVIVTRPASNNNDLQNLIVSPGDLDPAFTASTTRYVVNVDSGTAGIRVTATLQDTNSTLEVNGQGTASEQARTIDLGAPGSSRDISILVTAQNGTQKVYTVTVIKAALGSNNNLRSLTVSPGSLDPAFNANTTRYTVGVGSSTASVRVTATLQDTSGTLEVNQQGTSSGQARIIDLGDPGSSTEIEILAIAPNGSSKRYIVTVNRAAPSADNNLSALTVTPGTLDPNFTAGTLNYTVDVATDVTSVIVSATKSDPNAVISGDVSNQGQATVQLDGPGTSKNVSITVTAPNGSSKTYRLTVNRAAPSSDNNLSALVVSSGVLFPRFAPGTLTYTVTIPSSVSSVTVTATKSDPNAVMAASGSVIAAAGTPTGQVTVSLGIGTSASIAITVTAQNGSAKVYRLLINRPFR